jgi:hypothetical protein
MNDGWVDRELSMEFGAWKRIIIRCIFFRHFVVKCATVLY